MLCRNHIDVSEGVRRCARCGSPFCQSCLVDIGGKPYCATCKSEEILDVRSGVQSGELDLASVGRRFGAEFVDGFVLMIPIIVILVATTVAPANRFSNLGFILVSFAAVVYKALMLAARGQTLGKMAMKVKVVNADGSALSAGQAWGREIVRAVLGFLYIVDYIPAFFTQQKTTLHDMAAKTRVVNWT
jgi:uncharacterized RDD family membrane protein YckC